MLHDKPSAAKTLNEFSKWDRKANLELLQEAYILSVIDHPNIVHPCGLCLSPLILALEYMADGSLVGYLHSDLARQNSHLRDLSMICVQVAEACQYLESKSIIHRDISAKNCLIKLVEHSFKIEVCKLSDFGLAKDVNCTPYKAHGDMVCSFTFKRVLMCLLL